MMENMPYMLQQALDHYMRENGIKTFNIFDANQSVITIRFKDGKAMQQAMSDGLLSSETFHSSTSTRLVRNKNRSDSFKSSKKYNTRGTSKRKSNDIETPRNYDQSESHGLYSNLSPEAAEFPASAVYITAD